MGNSCSFFRLKARDNVIGFDSNLLEVRFIFSIGCPKNGPMRIFSCYPSGRCRWLACAYEFWDFWSRDEIVTFQGLMWHSACVQLEQHS